MKYAERGLLTAATHMFLLTTASFSLISIVLYSALSTSYFSCILRKSAISLHTYDHIMMCQPPQTRSSPSVSPGL